MEVQKAPSCARDRWSRRLLALALGLGAFGVLAAVTGGVYLELGGFVLSARDPLRPLGWALALAGAHVLVSHQRTAALKALVRLPGRLTMLVCAFRRRSAFANVTVLLLGLLFIALACWRMRGKVLVVRAGELEARGLNPQAAQLYENAARWAFGMRSDRIAHASYCYFRCGEFERSTRLIEATFDDTATMPRLAHKAYMHALLGLERHVDAAQAARAALASYPSLEREAGGVLAVAERLARSLGRPADPVEVELAFRPASAGAVELRGSWSEGRYSHTQGWTEALTMERGADGVCRVKLGLQTSRNLPYSCEARVLGDDGGVLESAVAMFHLEPAGQATRVELTAVKSPFVPLAARPRRTGADGVRRVLAVWPDCGSWPLLQLYGHAGRLPNMHALAASSRVFELISPHPPYTATAYLAMTTLSEEQEDSDFDVTRSLVVQLNGLPMIDQLIPDALTWQGPKRRTLFQALTEGGVSWSNMVFNDEHLSADEDQHGAPRAAQLAAVVAGGVALPAGADEGIEWFVDNTQAKASAAIDVWQREDARFQLVRFPAVDLATHRYWAQLEGSPHDNPLLQVYEHLDLVVGALRAQLDGDDVLILFSDHGIESTLAHHVSCFFFLEDPRLPGSRFEGTLPIRDFALLVLSRFGIEEGSERLDAPLRELLYP